MTEIPEQSRELVKLRDRWLCQRCGLKGAHWHHRRTRATHDEHTHCPCVGIWLCGICHAWVHNHPFLARADGMLMSKWEPEPYKVPVRTVHLGLIQPDCMGGYTFVTERGWPL